VDSPLEEGGFEPSVLSRATRLGHICRGSNVAYDRDRSPFLQPNFPMPLERSYSEDTRGSVFLGRGEVGDALNSRGLNGRVADRRLEADRLFRDL
jgi:hypothetical protein